LMALSLPRTATLRCPLSKENDQNQQLAVTAPASRIHTFTRIHPQVYMERERVRTETQSTATCVHHHDLLMADCQTECAFKKIKIEN
jgi:hypothetical protein